MRIPFFRGSSQLVSVVKDSDRGINTNQGVTPLAAGNLISTDLDVTGYSTLVLVTQIGNATTPATAGADAQGFVLPYLADDTLAAVGGQVGGIPAKASGNAGVGNGTAIQTVFFDVSGLSKVRCVLKNNNAGALQGARQDYFLQR